MKELSKIVQESVSQIENKYEHHNQLCDIFSERETCDCKQSDMRKDIISSQISLLEAELERKKGMIKMELCRDCYEESQEVEGYNNDIYHEEDCEYNDIINADITYLTEQIEEIKKLITK